MKKNFSQVDNTINISDIIKEDIEITNNIVKSSKTIFHRTTENNLIENTSINIPETQMSKSNTFKLSETTNFNTQNLSITSNLINRPSTDIVNIPSLIKSNNQHPNKKIYIDSFHSVNNINSINEISNHSPAKLSIKCNDDAFEKVLDSEIDVSSRKDSSQSADEVKSKQNSCFDFGVDSNFVELSILHAGNDGVKQIVHEKNEEIKLLNKKCNNFGDKIGFLNDELQKARKLIASLQNNLNVTEELNEFLEISIAKIRLDHSNEIDIIKSQIKNVQTENAQMYEKIHEVNQGNSQDHKELEDKNERIKSLEHQQVVKDNLISQQLQKNILNFQRTQNDLDQDNIYISHLEHNMNDLQLSSDNSISEQPIFPLKADKADECRKITRVMKSLCHNIYIGSKTEATDKVINIKKPYLSSKAKKLVFINEHKRKMIGNKTYQSQNHESFQQTENQETHNRNPKKNYSIETNNIKIKEVQTSLSAINAINDIQSGREILILQSEDHQNISGKKYTQNTILEIDQDAQDFLRQKSAYKENNDIIEKQIIDMKNSPNISNYLNSENSYKDFNSLSNISLSGFFENKNLNIDDLCNCNGSAYDNSPVKIRNNNIYTGDVNQYLLKKIEDNCNQANFEKTESGQSKSYNFCKKNYEPNAMANEIISEVTETSSTINDISNLRETIDSNSGIDVNQLKCQLNQQKQYGNSDIS